MMAGTNDHSRRAWTLARRQHDVVARVQLLALGFTPAAIEHRLATGRLHALWRGVYAVGRPNVTRYGRWMAAVLACGDGAALSHRSAAALYELTTAADSVIDVSVPAGVRRRQPGIAAHRRGAAEITLYHRIPVTTPALPLIDLATLLQSDRLEAAVNEADEHDLIDPESLRRTLDDHAGRPGVAALRRLIDRRTFVLTDSELERRLLPIARRAGLPKPETGRKVHGFRADFFWPDLGLVVETDGLRYHRTPAQQARDRLRDQTHAAAGLTPLRFTHAQVRFEPAHVQATLAAVARRLRAAASRPPSATP